MKTIDNLNDLQNPDLTERLARYLGAMRLHEMGNLSDAEVSKRLEDLQVACRAADRLFDMILTPSTMQEVATRMHAKLTGRSG